MIADAPFALAVLTDQDRPFSSKEGPMNENPTMTAPPSTRKPL